MIGARDRNLLWFLDASLVVALLSLPGVAWIALVSEPEPWFAGLGAIVLVNAILLRRLRSGYERRRPVQTLLVVCGLQWATCLAVSVVEPWSLHMTPLICLLPLAVAPHVLDARRLQHLALACLASVTVIVVVSRFTEGFGLHAATVVEVRHMVAIVSASVLTLVLSALAWRTHHELVVEAEEVRSSRQRLASASQQGRLQLSRRLGGLRSRLLAGQDALGAPGTVAGAFDARHWRHEIGAAAVELREISHGAFPADLTMHGPLHALQGLVEQPPWPVFLAADGVDELPEDLAPTIVWVVAEALTVDHGGVRPVASSVGVTLRSERAEVEIDITHRFDSTPPMSAGRAIVESVADRVAAAEGGMSLGTLDCTVTLTAHLPLEGGRRLDGQRVARLGAPTLTHAFRPLLIFPALALMVEIALATTILRSSVMTMVVLATLVGYAVPNLVGRQLAVSRPLLALVVAAVPTWIVAIIVVETFTFVRLFILPIVLAPVVAALPFVRPRVYAGMAIVATVVAVAIYAVGRLSADDPVAARSPELVNDLTAVLLIPSSIGVLLLLFVQHQASMLVLTDELRRSRRDLVAAVDRSRRQLERDLHDGVQQRLVSASLRLQIAERLPAEDEPAIRRNIALAGEQLRDATDVLFDLESGVNPVDGVDGLAVALRKMVATSPLPITLRIDLPPDREDGIDATIYLCCCECITNVAKHGGPAANTEVLVHERGGAVEFVVTDDGIGFEPSTAAGAGIEGMKDRVAALGGNLEVTSAPGSGTSVRGRIPRRQLAPV